MAVSPDHGKLDASVQGIHVPYQWTYADAAARTSATGFVATDVGKLARQLDNNSLWMLTATTPTWVALGVSDHGALSGLGDDDHPQYATNAEFDAHNHDGSGTLKLAQANTHESPDTDSGAAALHHTLGVGANQAAAGNHTHTAPAITREAIFTFSSALVVQSGAIRIYNKLGSTLTIQKVFLAVNTAPTGAAIIVDVNRNGTTIFTTQANRPQIADGANTGESSSIDVSSFADGDYLQADIDQIGSTAAGADLTVHVIYQ